MKNVDHSRDMQFVDEFRRIFDELTTLSEAAVLGQAMGDWQLVGHGMKRHAKCADDFDKLLREATLFQLQTVYMLRGGDIKMMIITLCRSEQEAIEWAELVRDAFNPVDTEDVPDDVDKL